MAKSFPSLTELRTSHQVHFSAVKYTNAQIRQKAKSLAKEINQQMAPLDKLICVMDGAFYWCNLLAPLLKPKNRINVNISFYEKKEIKLHTDKTLNKLGITGESVLVVEDIVCTGRTISHILKTLRKKNPAKLQVCSMIDKPSARFKTYSSVNKFIKNTGFISRKNEFLVGFGTSGFPPLPPSTRLLNGLYLAKKLPKDYIRFTKPKKLLKTKN